MTVFVFFSAAAGAGIITAHLGAGADYGFRDNIPFVIKPVILLFFEPGPLVVKVPKAVPLIGGLKFHDSFGIRRAALFHGDNFKAQPPGLFTPVPGLFQVNTGIVLSDTGVYDIIYRVFRIGAVAASHQGFGAGGRGFAGDIGFTAPGIGAA
jgi:hypothetical protein